MAHERSSLAEGDEEFARADNGQATLAANARLTQTWHARAISFAFIFIRQIMELMCAMLWKHVVDARASNSTCHVDWWR